MERVTMQIEGMSCGHCVRAVRVALEEAPGVVAVERVEVGTATVTFDPGTTASERLEEAVRDAGYEVAAR